MRMKKIAAIAIFSVSLVLYGCRSEMPKDGITEKQDEAVTEGGITEKQDGAVTEGSITEKQDGAVTEGSITEKQDEAVTEDGMQETTEPVRALQGGPYGRLSISLPHGWSYEACPVDSDGLISGIYGIRFYPRKATEGCIELVYMDSFGVCGTGLKSETAVIAGSPASVGTYDGQEYFSFISFQEEYEGVVALTYSADEWWEEYGSQAMEILDTLSFEKDVKEGGAYVYDNASQIEEIGLQFSLKNISYQGATLVFNQYDKDAPIKELQFGDEFVLEQLKDGEWKELPVVVEGNYAFHDVAYFIKAGSEVEKELDWKWLYGELSPGDYRIIKTVDDFRQTGDYDRYTVYARFFLT